VLQRFEERGKKSKAPAAEPASTPT